MMVLAYSILVGVLMAVGLYLLLQSSLVRIVLGLSLIGNAANLVLFSSGKFLIAKAPLIIGDQKVLEAPFADPVPQALILTAIVIGFGILAFFLVLSYRVFARIGTDQIEKISGERQ